MNRHISSVRLVALLALFLVTGCSHGGKELMGDPQYPYPRQVPPKVGEIVHLPTGIPVTRAQMLAMAGATSVTASAFRAAYSVASPPPMS
jgi:hypothetical protein